MPICTRPFVAAGLATPSATISATSGAASKIACSIESLSVAAEEGQPSQLPSSRSLTARPQDGQRPVSPVLITHKPAALLGVIPGLVRPDFLIEIEVVAAVPAGKVKGGPVTSHTRKRRRRDSSPAPGK